MILTPIAEGKGTYDDANAEAFIGRVIEADGQPVEVDMEMATCVNDYIRQVELLVPPGSDLFVEIEVPISQITGEKDATGTSDVIGVVGTELVVADLKGGRGVMVYAEDNEQLDMYAGGALDAYQDFFEIETIRKVIIQPRLDHVDEEVLTVAELRERLDGLSAAAGETWEAQATYDSPEGIPRWSEAYLAPGEKQCRFCKAKATCPALRGYVDLEINKAAPAAAEDFPDLSLPKRAAAVADRAVVDLLDDDKLAEAMRAADLIEIWLKAVRAEVEARLMSGVPIPGWKVVQGKRGNRAWTNADEAEKAMKAGRLKVDEMYTKSLISVTVAEKLLKEQPKLWSRLCKLIGQSEGKPSVAPESDPRPALEMGAKAEDFPELVDEEDLMA